MSAFFRRLPGLLLIGLILAGGVTAYLFYFRPSPSRTLAQGQKAYEEGVQALENKEPARAAGLFREAVDHASRVLEALEKERRSKKSDSHSHSKQQVRLEGQACWLKAQALRDEAHASALEASRPISVSTDTISGETYRAVLAIPDGKVRLEALKCLTAASVRLPDNKDVQREALRAMVAVQPPPWHLIEKICLHLLALDPADTRANQQLASYHYEQPMMDARGHPGPSLPLEKRSQKRMLLARKYAEDTKQSRNYRVWRTAELEARITLWLRDHGKLSREEEQQEDHRVRELLLDEKTGVLTRAREDSKLEQLSPYDLRAALHLHQLALEEVIRLQEQQATDRAEVQRYLEAVLALCKRLSTANIEPANARALVMEDCTLTAIQSVAAARPRLLALPTEERDRRIDEVRTLVQKAQERKVVRPAIYAGLARLLDQEATLAQKQKNTARKQQLDTEAGQWIETGLKLAQDAGLKREQTTELHSLVAERKARGS